MLYCELLKPFLIVLVVPQEGQILDQLPQYPEVGQTLELSGVTVGDLEVKQVGRDHALLVPPAMKERLEIASKEGPIQPTSRCS